MVGGINAVIVGNYLTTLGRDPQEDLDLLAELLDAGQGAEQDAVSYCAGCGQADRRAITRGCLRPLDPPRFCTQCGRKLKVQVLPTGYTAQCVRCP